MSTTVAKKAPSPKKAAAKPAAESKYSMEIDDSELSDQSYCEASQKSKIRFTICRVEGKKVYRLFTVMKCREYLGDYWEAGRYDDKGVSIYGFHAEPKQIHPLTHLLFHNVKAENLKGCGVKSTPIMDDNTFLIELPSYVRSATMVSYFTLKLRAQLDRRVAVSLDDGYNSIMNKGAGSNEENLLRRLTGATTGRIIQHIAEHQDELFPKDDQNINGNYIQSEFHEAHGGCSMIEATFQPKTHEINHPCNSWVMALRKSFFSPYTK